MLGKDFRQPVGVLREVFERYCTVLDEGHRFSVALHRHHDVEPGFAHFPDFLLQRRIRNLRHCAGMPEIAHHLCQALQLCNRRVPVLAREFHQQNCLGLAFEELCDNRAECGVAARQIDHGAIHQFDGVGVERDDMPGQVHRLVKAGEVHHAKDLVCGNRREFQRHALRERQRAFRTDQQVREVVRSRVRVTARQYHIQVVALHPAQHLGPARLDLFGFASRDGMDLRDQRAIRGCSVCQRIARAEMKLVPAGQPGINAQHVVHHIAVADGARATGVVTGHSANGGLRGGGHVHREPELVRAHKGIELVEHHPRLHRDFAPSSVEFDNSGQALGAVDNQSRADALSTLRGPGAARQNWHAFLGCDLQRNARRLLGSRHDYSDRLYLVDRGVGAVATARERIEQHLAFHFSLQAPCQHARGSPSGAY